VLDFKKDYCTGNSMQRMYLQQIITLFEGGRVTQLPSFSYKVTLNKNVVIRRMIVDLNDIEKEILTLAAEANRFMYMYCRI
jgi:hypothetical protein